MATDILAQITQIDTILDLNREALLDAEKMKESKERGEKIAKVKERINKALDDRWVLMKERDK